MLLVVLALCVAGFLATTILNKLKQKWSLLPHFIYNGIGGMWGVCSITDFKKTPLESFTGGPSAEIRKFRRVPETMVFRHPPGTKDAQRFSGTIQWLGREPWGDRGVFHPAKESLELFVPFASEAHILFSEQERFFTAAQDPDEFTDRKREENYKNDLRLRLAAHMKERDLDGWQMLCAVASIVMLFVIIFVELGIRDKQADARTIVTHLTTIDGKLLESQFLGKEEYKLLVYEDPSVGSYTILKGRATKILYVGGGNSRICVQRPNYGSNCGFAAASLRIKEGDEAYLRTAKMLRWTRESKVETGHSDDGWFVTKAEAEKLQATGKFTIIE